MKSTFVQPAIFFLGLLSISSLALPGTDDSAQRQGIASIHVISPAAATQLNPMRFGGVECIDGHKNTQGTGHQVVQNPGHSCEITITPPEDVSFDGTFVDNSAGIIHAAEFSIVGSPNQNYRIEFPRSLSTEVISETGETGIIAVRAFTAYTSNQGAIASSGFLDSHGADSVFVGATVSIPSHFKLAANVQLDIHLIITYE